MRTATAAYTGAALFVGLMIAFSATGSGVPERQVLAIGMLGIASHLVLLPVVSVTGKAPWARACGYTWIAIDVMLNVAAINGMAMTAVTPLRLGGHVLAAVWICDAASAARGLAKPVGFLLAMLLAFHALAAPWIPAWVLFIPFTLIPAWLAVLARTLQVQRT